MSKFLVKNDGNSVEVKCFADVWADKTIFFASNDKNADIYKQHDWESMSEDEVIKKLDEMGILKEQGLKYDGFFPNLSKKDALYNSNIDDVKDKRNTLINAMNIDTTKPYFNAMTNYCSGCCQDLEEAEAYFNAIGFKFKEVFEKFQFEHFALKNFNKYYDEIYNNDIFDLIVEDKFIDYIKSESNKRKEEIHAILTGDRNRVLRENIIVMSNLLKPYIECELNVLGNSDYSDSDYRDFNDDKYYFLTSSEYAAIYNIYCKNTYPTTWEKIEEKEFDNQLNVLPPKRHEQIHSMTFFQSSEKELGNITRTFAKFGDKFFKSYQKSNVDYGKLYDSVMSYIQIDNNNRELIKTEAANVLSKNGYEIQESYMKDNTGAIAIKKYKTDVGINEAHIYLSKGDDFTRTLSLDYNSAGKVFCSELIPIKDNTECIINSVENFIKESELAINKSYSCGVPLENEDLEDAKKLVEEHQKEIKTTQNQKVGM